MTRAPLLPAGAAICYSGYREGQSPDTQVYPRVAQIREDLHLLAPILTRTRKRDVQEHAPTRRSATYVCQWGDSERRAYCALLGIEPAQAMAVGDGANDLPMMGAAGLSVAYCAKPRVRDAARVSINQGGLQRLLDVLL